ncbi:Superkiller protein 3 [Ophiocordyceps camponoti-floridani]|uniref:Superkiller protein 3 n=1 Tax=Ophiocordyceps camponoti-floridani TaxID=2030778 RepID=A0A8H4VDZ4_9HYPO|nr:Superkiller protein 3 [Ophiocordyceps camponoti-floridani]
MSRSKATLKGINDAIRQNKFDDAAKAARELLSKDAKNYQGRVFLAFALDNKNELIEAETVYLEAIESRPQDPQAYQGLVKVYEKMGTRKLTDYQRIVINLARILADAGEAYKSQDVVDKFIDFARSQGSPLQYADALCVRLPESPLYSVLEGRFPQPAETYEAITRIVEDAEKRRINTLIGERRTRLGATLVDVTLQVKREVYGQSRLEHLYRQLINWTSDDNVRRVYEEKLLQYCHDRLLFLPSAAKLEQQTVVIGLARDMVIIKHPFKLAWDIGINWQDNKEISDWDIEVLRNYCSFFPESDLYKVITAYLTSSFSPFPELKKPDKQEVSAATSDDSEDDDDGGGAPTAWVPLTEEDRLVMITEGMSMSESTFAYRLAGHYFLQLGEYETTVELMRKAQQYVTKERAKTGLPFRDTQDAYSLYLATALVYYQSPRHHQEAKTLFDGVLEHDATRTSALIGVGLIFEEEQDYDEAIDFLSRALERDGSNLRVRSEAAWVKALKGDWQTAKDELMCCIEPLESQGGIAKEMLAETQYRVGCCIWNLDTGRQSRKQKKGECAYAYWLAALGNNMKHAPSYTSLGLFYRDYAKDRNRARRCFQKALELSSAEVTSAQSLAQSFAEDADWERVELVARRVVDSGVVRPPPGSKRKGISWPFSALGVAELNKRDFHKAIVSFQSALKLSPDDYHSWVGLGESYHSSGRFMAATKAILNAQELEADGRDVSADTWFTKYMLANIKRELGEYDESVMLYQSVLETRPAEEGVMLALMQTMTENALSSAEKGLFGKAIQLAIDTVHVAADTGLKVRGTFNFWKSLAEACSVFTLVHGRAEDFPTQALRGLLEASDQKAYEFLAHIDRVGTDVIYAKGIYAEDEQPGVDRTRCVHATILCHKQAIHISSSDQHAQAVAHYNLGWAEYRAHVCLPLHLRRKPSSYLRASVRALKRSIELESGNAEFWNALGVATSEINPAVSQHALVRSLHLNERSPATWTNLGTLALLSKDLKLANEAFTRAQSTDPDYAHAWLGRAFIALLVGNADEARSLFTHALDMAESCSLPSRQHYAAAVFDHVLSCGASDSSVVSLIQPLFALGQIQSLRPQDLVFTHMTTLFLERTRESPRAIRALQDMCGAIEADYETTESADSLVRFTLAKADLARAYLASGSYEQAVECGETALGLSGEEGEGELTSEQRKRVRLSAQLTTGLGHFFLSAFDEAEKCFEAALEESGGDPDAACLLAQVLWAQGSEASRQRARSTLLDVIETRQDHVQSVLLLGTVALLDNDEDGLEAVTGALQGLGASDGVTTTEQSRVCDVLGAIAMKSAGDDGNSQEDEMLAQLHSDIMLRPHLPDGWGSLAEATGDGHAATMALRVAARGIPPRGTLEAEQLARAYAGTGMAADAQRAVMVAPWVAVGGEALKAATEGL